MRWILRNEDPRHHHDFSILFERLHFPQSFFILFGIVTFENCFFSTWTSLSAYQFSPDTFSLEGNLVSSDTLPTITLLNCTFRTAMLYVWLHTPTHLVLHHCLFDGVTLNVRLKLPFWLPRSVKSQNIGQLTTDRCVFKRSVIHVRGDSREVSKFSLRNAQFSRAKLSNVQLDVHLAENVEIQSSTLMSLHASMDLRNKFVGDDEPCVAIESSHVSSCTFLLKHASLKISECVFDLNPPPSDKDQLKLVSGAAEHTNVSIKNTVFDASRQQSMPSILVLPRVENMYMRNVKVLCAIRLVQETARKVSRLKCSSLCQPGRYRDKHAKANLALVKADPGSSLLSHVVLDEHCVICPIGASCVKNDIATLPDYWGFSDEKGKVRTIRCPENYCCESTESCRGINSCRKGRAGRLCGVCESNMTETLFSPACVPTETCEAHLVMALYISAALTYTIFLLTFKNVKEMLSSCVKVLYVCVEKRVKSSGLQGLIELHTKRNDRVTTNALVSTLLLAPKPTPVEVNTCTKAETSFVRRSQSLELNPKSFLFPNENVLAPLSEVKVNDTVKEEQDKAVEDTAQEESGMKYIQIVFYFVQDAALFNVEMPQVGPVKENFMVRFLQFSPQLLLLYYDISSLCLDVSFPAPILKVILTSIIGIWIMTTLLLVYVVQWALSKCIKPHSNSWSKIRGRLCEAFILTVLLSYQRIVKGTFTLVTCQHVEFEPMLYIQAEIHCGAWWQFVLQMYLYLSVVPVFLVLAIGPFLIRDKQMSVSLFIVACFLPLPTAMYFCLSKAWRICKKKFCNRNKNQSFVKESIWKAFFAKDPETIYTESEEVLMETLLKHYRTLRVCGVDMTWLGIHKLYRMSLILCTTYITEPLPRLYAMNALVVTIVLFTAIVRPYKDATANSIANFANVASICIGMVNLVRAALLTGNFARNTLTESILAYSSVLESVLLNYMPVAAVSIWVVHALGTKIHAKFGQKKTQPSGSE